MKQSLLISLCCLGLIGSAGGGCAGPDYDPVYFASSQKEGTNQKPNNNNSDLSQTHCKLEMTAKLCVKIKGGKIDVGTNADKPLCADTPPIPFTIEGEKISIKGSEFPDINVSADIKGVATPLTINGKGETDGASNIGTGTWVPDGHILIQNFSFFISVLGMSGEIPGIDLTTDEAHTVPDLPALKGMPAKDSGEIKLVTATVLSHLFKAADAYLLGASLQAVFDGKLDPPLAECAQTKAGEKKIKIVKLRPAGNSAGGGNAGDGANTFIEEPLPQDNILEVSQGVTIARSDTDVGPKFEETTRFKAINTAKKPLEIKMPTTVGDFSFFTEGTTHKTLGPGQSFAFQITFRPEAADAPQPGVVKEKFSLGGESFELRGTALNPQGGVAISPNTDMLDLSTLSVSATPARDFFHCRTITCRGGEAITDCRPCTPNSDSACTLQTINAQRKPVEEVKADCEPRTADSAPQMQLNLGGSATSGGAAGGKETITLQNNGVADLEIQHVAIEEFPNSRSTGEFQFSIHPAALPITLSPASSTPVVSITVTYLPHDLTGFDGSQAQTGEPAVDKATLVIKTNGGEHKTVLTGKTKIQETPPLQAFFGTATGLKAKSGSDTFSFEEITQNTQNLAYPVFLNVSEAATAGVRITDIKIQGDDTANFEWLTTQEEVDQRRPPAGAGKRCSIPLFDPTSGRLLQEQFDLSFVSLGSQGFDLKPGVFSANNLPLFGCVNFHPSQTVKKIFKTDLIVSGIQLDSQGRPLHNADGSSRNMNLTIHLVAALNPIKGKMVLRVSQTVAAILNPQSPSLTALPAKKEVEQLMAEGRGTPEESIVLLGALILDPFDEMEIKDTHGHVVSTSGDGVTAIFRAIDTRPTATAYPNNALFDYATLLHDSSLAEDPGIFSDYEFPNHPLPNPLKVNGWRIFTGALSYPGPLSPRSPISRSECEVIDPCSPEGLRKFTAAGVGPDGKGACAFFYMSGGRYQSPSFEPVLQGVSHNLCDVKEQKQELLDMNKGHYSVDGQMTFEDLGLRFWGPTYIHNPQGPLGFKPPLDEVFHLAFTTEMLKPNAAGGWNVLPDEKIDLGKEEFKINLTEEGRSTPAICPKNMHNRRIHGHLYSSWRYFAPLLFKDEAGTIPAGCPEGKLDGGTAYIKGRSIDPDTKIFTIVTTAKFGSNENLSLAFKNIMLFVALDGWICDPQGNEADFEGAKCFDPKMNDRDAKAQISILQE